MDYKVGDKVRVINRSVNNIRRSNCGSKYLFDDSNVGYEFIVKTIVLSIDEEHYWIREDDSNCGFSEHVVELIKPLIKGSRIKLEL